MSDSAFSDRDVLSDFEVLEKDIEQWMKPVDIAESKQPPINLFQHVSRVRAIGFDSATGDLGLGDLDVVSPRTNVTRDALGRAAWATCAVAVREYDRNIIGQWHQDLDNLLVFAALFSAVITALLVESSGIPDVDDNPSTRLTVMNAFWVCSLVLALNSVTMTILVKQWLAEYTWDVGTSVLSPKQSFALRHLRFELLHKWHVPTIIDYLPLQLLLAVMLFYGGLATFLTMMHPVVAGLGIGLIGVSVILFVLTALIPSWWPMSPYQSPQAWLSYRFSRAIGSLLAPLSRSRALGNQKGVEANGWVDHGIQMIQSQKVVGKYETDGLLWVQRSLGVWDPQLIQAAFSCALSLPDPTRVKTLLSLCIKHIPSSILNSDDSEDGLEFSSKFSDTLGQTIFIEVYAAIHEHLSKFLDSEQPLGNSIAEETLQDGVRVLLILVRHPWTHVTADGKGELNGWNLLFGLVASTNFSKIPPVVRVIVTRRALGTFLDDALADDERRKAGDASSGKGLPAEYARAIRPPRPWFEQAFDASGDAEQELLWVLSASCALFALINGHTADSDANGLSSCWRNTVQYLETKSNQGGSGENMENAVRYWTRILSYRGSSKSNGCMELLAERGSISGTFHVELRSLLDVLSIVVAANPTLWDLKAPIWRLQLLNASDAQEVLTIFSKGNEVAGDYLKESMCLSSRMGGITPEELSLVGDVMMKEFPTSPWDSDRRDRNYQHALLACLLVHITADYNLALDHSSGEVKAQSRPLEAVARLLQLLMDDEETISLLEKGQQAALEFLLVAIFQQIVKSWAELSPKPDETLRSLIFEALFNQCSKDQPRTGLVLSLIGLSLHALEVDGNLTVDPEPTKVLEGIHTFLESRVELGTKELPQTQTSVHQCVDGVFTILTFGSAASDPENSESLGKLLQALRNKCDYASWHHSSKELLAKALRSLQNDY